MNVRISLETTPEAAIRILDFASRLDSAGGSQLRVSARSVEGPLASTEAPGGSVALEIFCGQLKPPARKAALLIAGASARHERLSPGDVTRAVENANYRGEQAGFQTMGFMGSIGKAWHKCFPETTNPFLSLKDPATGDYYHLLDEELALRLLALLGLEEDR